MTKHPAKFLPEVVDLAAPFLADYPRVLDPFAGTGRVHLLPNDTVGVELEPEWAEMHPDTIVGDVMELPFPPQSFDAVFTSPTYGNRFADHHEASDGSQRRSYTHDLGRKLSPNNSGVMHWGDEYRKFHVEAWMSVRQVVRLGGRMVLNIKNHIRKGEEQLVVEWHLMTLLNQGWKLYQIVPIPAKGLQHGENRQARVPYEFLLVFTLGR